jgi:hypothetical protein
MRSAKLVLLYPRNLKDRSLTKAQAAALEHRDQLFLYITLVLHSRISTASIVCFDEPKTPFDDWIAITVDLAGRRKTIHRSYNRC